MVLLMVMVMSCCLLLTGCKQQPISTMGTEPPTEDCAAETEPQLKDDLQTILVMGLDKYEAKPKEMGYLNDQQSDFLMLVVLDEKAGTSQVLHLNRDTMTEIRRLGVGGGDAGRFTGQLALAHTYGSGGSDSCLNACKAVSTLLGGIHIDHYIALTMDAVALLNDQVGGVTVEIMDDFTHLDPAMIQGETVTLHGEQALLYVRTRGSLEDSSNLHRMERQRQYLNALYEHLLKARKEDEHFLQDSLLELSSSFQSDLTVNQLSKLGETMLDLELQPFMTIEGEAVKGEEFMEFYPDEASLDQVIQDLFYED